MKKSYCMSVALVAGTALSSAAFAQLSHPGVSQGVSAGRQAQRATPPSRVRSVRLVNGHIEGVGPWKAYGTGATDNPPQYVFDAIQDGPGVTPGTGPATGRYLFNWTPGLFDYSSAVRTFDMADIPAAAQGQTATIADFLVYENNGTLPLYVGIFTAETFDPTTAPGATWGLYDGVQFAWDTGIGNGFWFASGDTTTAGIGWTMPTDGSGAYIFSYTRDSAGVTPAVGVQPGCWFTGEDALPPNARVGTQGSVGQTDESTPPNCGALDLLTNIPNGIIEPTCETYDWTFAIPEGTHLAPAIGFGMKLTVTNVCYANCDSSTTQPCLNVLDFGCFLNKFAAGDTYANCDNSTTVPVLNVLDFGCFLNKFAAGCSSC